MSREFYVGKMRAMSSLASKDEPPVVFVIPSFRIRLITPIIGIVFFVGLGAYIPLKVGLARTADRFAEHPQLWWVLILLLAGIILFFVLFLLARNLRARLEIWRDRLLLTPDPMQRTLGDLPVEVKIPVHAKEVLLRHSSMLGLRFGYSITVRDESGAQHELKSTSLNRLNRRDSLRLADAISTATGLPVRIIRRLTAVDGSLRDAPWS